MKLTSSIVQLLQKNMLSVSIQFAKAAASTRVTPYVQSMPRSISHQGLNAAGIKPTHAAMPIGQLFNQQAQNLQNHLRHYLPKRHFQTRATDMKLPIGSTDFREIVSQDYTLVDKSLFIKDVIDDGSKVILITRPRRFGKTLNMQMLQHFFAKEAYDLPTQGLFDKLKINAEGEKYMQHQGQYPVVFLTFKDIKYDNFDSAHAKFANIMSEAYATHRYLLDSEKLMPEEKEVFTNILRESATDVHIVNSLKKLLQYLTRYHAKKPVLLIDEYDTPIQASYTTDNNFYTSMIGFMRNFFSEALKDNSYLEKAVLTGVLRISKESLFTGVNNITVHSLLDASFSEHFGFAEKEVNELLEKAQMINYLDTVKEWYNGYQCGDSILYNPWSILNCIDERGNLQPYWINTSDNALIKRQLIQSSIEFKAELENLLQGKSVKRLIDEHIVFGELASNPAALWSLLLMTGYLKVVAQERDSQGLWCMLAIPNREVRDLYRQIIEQWLSNGKGVEWYNKFLNSLLQGDMPQFALHLDTFFKRTVSTFDLAKQPEAFFHGLMLGFTASIEGKHYALKSNDESVYGRYDIGIIAKDTNKLSILLELKIVVKPKGAKYTAERLKETLKQEALTALQQINPHEYDATLKQHGSQQVVKIGIAFHGKRFEMVHKKTNLSSQAKSGLINGGS